MLTLLKNPHIGPHLILSFISKLIERIVAKRLNEHIAYANLHVDSQHGCASGHSTETLLVKFMNDILVDIDKNRGVVVLLVVHFSRSSRDERTCFVRGK